MRLWERIKLYKNKGTNKVLRKNKTIRKINKRKHRKKKKSLFETVTISIF